MPACLPIISARRKSTCPQWQRCIGLAFLLMTVSLGAAGCSRVTARAKSEAHHRIHLQWNAPAHSGASVAGYNIYRSSDGGNTFTKVNKSPVAKTEYDDTAVQGGVTYIYLVKTVDHKGAESTPSNRIRLSVP